MYIMHIDSYTFIASKIQTNYCYDTVKLSHIHILDLTWLGMYLATCFVMFTQLHGLCQNDMQT